MPQTRHCCLILLVVLFSESSSGAEPISKYVCQGDYVQVFQNVTIAQGNPVNLYTNGVRQMLIGTWSLNQASSVLQGYKEKVFLDEYGTIWIRNIQLSDEVKYVLSYGTEASKMKSAVQIYVMVAPTKYCKPKIKKTDNLLTASLEADECGIPPASVHWVDYPDIYIIAKDVLKLPPEKEAGTYYACAESPALICVKNFKLSDYCTAFTVQGKVPSQGTEAKIGQDKDNSQPVSSEISDIKTVTFVTVTLVAVIVFAVPTTTIIILLLRRKKRPDVMLVDDTNADPKTKKSNVETKPLLNENFEALQNGKVVDSVADQIMKSPQITVHIQADAEQRKSIFDVFTGQHK